MSETFIHLLIKSFVIISKQKHKKKIKKRKTVHMGASRSFNLFCPSVCFYITSCMVHNEFSCGLPGIFNGPLIVLQVLEDTLEFIDL